jgi:hypothetical protein
MRATASGLVVGVLGILVVGVSLLAAGCGGGGSASCAVGTVGCPCTGGGACDPNLTCASNRCVNLNTVPDGGGAGTGGAGTSGGTPADACNTFTGYCAKLNACAPLAIKIDYGTVDECNARFKLSCVDATSAPGSGLTATTIAACGAALPDAACADVIYRNVAACNIKGTRANGMACGTNSQCTTGYCAQSDQACGVCSALVGAGNGCMVDDDCQAGFVCNSTNVCVLPGGAGANCTDAQPCGYGFYCLVVAGTTTGSCAAGVETPGGTCNGTLAASCDLLKGIFCNATNTCENLGVASPGDSCGLVGEKLTFCSTGECIYPTVDATEGVCRALAADGATCDAATTCETPAHCVSGKCKLPSSSACL